LEPPKKGLLILITAKCLILNMNYRKKIGFKKYFL
jgi:hypothetical protein